MSTATANHRTASSDQRGLTSWLGIDIGTSGIKIAEVARRRSGPRWLSRAHYKFEHPLPETDSDIELIRSTLADALPPAGDGLARPAVVSLPSSWCVSRIARADAIDDIRKQMNRDLGQKAQWCAWHMQSSDGPGHIASYGIGGELAEMVGDVVTDSGHRCVQIDAHPLALHRSIKWMADNSADSLAGILDWGWDSCVLVVCSADGPGVVRNLPGCGLRSLVELAANRLGSDSKSVLSLLRQRPSDQSHPDARRGSDQARDILLPSIGRVATEIKQSLQYAERIGCQPMGTSLMLCGGASCLPAAHSLLAKETQSDVALWSWGGAKSFEDSLWSPPEAMFAVALALGSGEGK